MREKEEEEEEEVVEGEAMYMVPLEEGEDEGSGSQQELMVQSSGPHAAQTDTPDTTSSKISNGRIANPKLNRLIRGRPTVSLSLLKEHFQYHSPSTYNSNFGPIDATHHLHT